MYQEVIEAIYHEFDFYDSELYVDFIKKVWIPYLILYSPRVQNEN